MFRIVAFAIASGLLLAGCSNYVGQVDDAQARAESPPPLNSFDDGERYVRALRTQFQRRIGLLEAQDNLLQGGIIGGGIMALVGVVNRAPRTALNGAAIGGGTFAYGQTLNPDALRKIYLVGDQSLVCVLSEGRRAHESTIVIEIYVRDAVAKARELEGLITAVERNGNAHEIPETLRVLRTEARRTWVAAASWTGNGATISRRMASAADLVVSDTNLAIKAAEPTLVSLRNATAAAIDAVPKKQPLPNNQDEANKALAQDKQTAGALAARQFLGGVSEPLATHMAPGVRAATDTAIARIQSTTQNLLRVHAEIVAINQIIEALASNPASVPVTSFARCQPQFDGEQPILTFKMEPQEIGAAVNDIALLTVVGGRAPYTWVADGNAVAAFNITQIGSGSNNAIFQISRKTAGSMTGSIVFSSVHPRASPQAFMISSK